ncbi:hypothetical protein [Antrihabitans cavernicola]|uniref:Uncharacterized protein n=1 Tax=Antrihabitans cavernicola TaxID=2495913 RepID=A0A5A7S6E8_9NOCA|nr:hypothetical protein [Spelaeibacter cavernicola]KAA0021690.1 hypothetical protein FOY51_17535 [Spelaeibacter cavernicola]
MTERHRRPTRASAMRMTADDRRQLAVAIQLIAGIATAVVLFFSSTSVLPDSTNLVVRGAVVPLVLSAVIFLVCRFIEPVRAYGRTVLIATAVVVFAVFVAYYGVHAVFG